MKLWLLISLPLYILDQLTKWLVLAHISTDELIPVIPGFFNLVQVHNTGAAFGMLRDNNLFFVILSFSALIFLAILAWKGVFQDWTSRWAGALLVAGVAGNLTDRILHGHVVDFLDVGIGAIRWPTFNVADIAVSCGAIALVISMWREDSRRAEPESASAA